MSSSLDKGRVKVCILTSVHPVFDARIFHKEAKTLVKAGYKVVLIAQHSKEETVDGVRIVPLPTPKNRFERMTKVVWKLFRLALKEKAEIYHFHDPELIPAGLLLKKIKGAHVINDVHEDHKLMQFKHYIPKGLRKLTSAIVNQVENFGTKRFDAVITPTKPITARFAKIAPRVITLYNFPTNDFIQSADKFKTGIEECSYDVAHVGVLREDRLGFLLDVAGEVQRKLGPQKWVFVGMPVRLEPIAKRLAKQRRLEGVTLVPRMPFLEIPNIICRSRIAVNFHPLGEAHTKVAIPVKIFEYLACGLPVVSTPLPLVRQLLGNAPMVKLADDKVGDFSTAVIELLSNADLTVMRDMALKYSRENYTWTHEGKKLLELYKDILRD